MQYFKVKFSITIVLAVFVLCLSGKSSVAGKEPPMEKEWTFLTFLNGNNNLDYYGAVNINQMETVGSTEDINIVVQWASYRTKKVQRVFVTKDNDINKVTSPIVEDMGRVDMGDWRNLVEFVRWGVANYPAKKYFLNVWDHGSGWHLNRLLRGEGGGFISPMDISWDDFTGNSITTIQLGMAMKEIATVIGHPLDLYGSDACLMAMAEVANEMSDSVTAFAGSEEVEPALGWPYHTLMEKWVAMPKATGAEVGKILTEEFIKYYIGLKNQVTFSTFDLTQMGALNTAVSNLGADIMKLNANEITKVRNVVYDSQNYFYSDYVDLGDFVLNLKAAQIQEIGPDTLANVDKAIGAFVVTVKSTPSYEKSKGVSLWIPSSTSGLNNHIEKYRRMKFHEQTRWGDALDHLY